jgi:hypothetical protein
MNSLNQETLDMALHGIMAESTERKKYNKQKMNEPKTIKLTGVFPKTFRVSKCESGRADCNFEYTDKKKKVFFEVCLHGAIELHEHFLGLGYTELAPKLEFPTWHPNYRNLKL